MLAKGENADGQELLLQRVPVEQRVQREAQDCFVGEGQVEVEEENGVVDVVLVLEREAALLADVTPELRP